VIISDLDRLFATRLASKLAERLFERLEEGDYDKAGAETSVIAGHQR
jgi:hypothetical protein